MDQLRMHPPNPKFLQKFWYNVSGFARNGDPGKKIRKRYSAFLNTLF